MGSWSVYCGISNIAITSGNKCALLPLKKSENGRGYLPHTPATLPIFGEYNDYGGIENIVQDDNTKLIEKHFGITIDEFAIFLLDGKHTYDREEAKEVEKKMKNFQEAKEWKHMWIDRQVYDFMSINLDTHSKGHCHFGNKTMMEALGFEFVGEEKENDTYDPKRFCQKWKHGDKFFFTDGWTLLSGITKKDSYVYYYDREDYGKAQSLTTYIDVPENMQWLKDKAEWHAWRYKEKGKQISELFWILDKSDYELTDDIVELLLKASGKPMPKKVYKTLLSKYVRDINDFGDRVADLITVRHNLHCMSGVFTPFVLYTTPQCGEHVQHQVLLDKFAEINRDIIKERQ